MIDLLSSDEYDSIRAELLFKASQDEYPSERLIEFIQCVHNHCLPSIQYLESLNANVPPIIYYRINCSEIITIWSYPSSGIGYRFNGIDRQFEIELEFDEFWFETVISQYIWRR